MYLLGPRDRHRKGDVVEKSFLNYGPRSLPRLLTREDNSSRKISRKIRSTAPVKIRLQYGRISAIAIIPAGTRCEPAGLECETLTRSLWQIFDGRTER
jgi:hypothetical protein